MTDTQRPALEVEAAKPRTRALAYPGRHRVKGGRVVHATYLAFVDGFGVQMTACGKRANAALPESCTAQITCKACAPHHDTLI